MAFATNSMDAVTLRNNAALVAHAARLFEVSTILTTVAEESFSGLIFREFKETLPDVEVMDRTTMNTFEATNIVIRVNAIGTSRIVLGGLWTSVCVVGMVLSAIDQGFEVYVIADACGDVNDESRGRAMDRRVLAGARLMTSLQYLIEFQRDWARSGTYDPVVNSPRPWRAPIYWA